MFEFLEQATVDEVVSSVYYAIRLIRHRTSLVDLDTGLRVEGLASEPSFNEEVLAVRALRSIESAEDTSIQELDDSTAEDYISQLAGIVRARAIAEFGCDEGRGRHLLARFETPIAYTAERAVLPRPQRRRILTRIDLPWWTLRPDRLVFHRHSW